MDEQTLQKIDEIIAGLPPVIQERITDNSWKLQISDIIHRYNLRLDIAGELETEVFLIMVGLETQENLERNLAAASVPAEHISAIITDLDKLIFEPMRQSLVEATSEPIAPTTVNKIPYQSLETRDDLLRQIEDPEETPPIQSSPVRPTDPEIQQADVEVSVANAAPATKIDPYREPIE